MDQKRNMLDNTITSGFFKEIKGEKSVNFKKPYEI